MAKAVTQFRFYGQDNANNYPATGTINDYISGKVFTDKNCYPILQLGIQALPGFKFYLNDGVSPIVIGSTGIYELDIDGLAEINKITFDKFSMQNINSSSQFGLIVDIVYEDGTGEEDD